MAMMRKFLMLIGAIVVAGSLTGCVVYEEDMDDDYEIEYEEEDDEEESEFYDD